jgi:hypothetical protein
MKELSIERMEVVNGGGLCNGGENSLIYGFISTF